MVKNRGTLPHNGRYEGPVKMTDLKIAICEPHVHRIHPNVSLDVSRRAKPGTGHVTAFRNVPTGEARNAFPERSERPGFVILGSSAYKAIDAISTVQNIYRMSSTEAGSGTL